MRSIKEIWDKIEKWVIYVALGAFLLLQLLSNFINNDYIITLTSNTNVNVFIATILLYLFIFVDRRLPLDHKGSLMHFSKFDDAVDYVFSRNLKFEKIDIFAHSSEGYYNLIRNQLTDNKKVGVIRVAVRNPNSANFLSHLKNRGAADTEKSQITNKITSWEYVKTRGVANDISVFMYDFEPSFNMMIVDEKIIIFEIFEPTQHGWGYTNDQTFVVEGKDTTGLLFIEGLNSWYSSTITEKCARIEI